MDFTLFRLYPILEEKLKYLTEQNITDVLDALDFIQKVEDPGIRFSDVELEDVSLAFLANAIETNLEKALYAVITGRPVYVIGARSTVRLVIDILSIFTQHFSIDFRDWVSLEEVVQRGECIKKTRICGMSVEVFEKHRLLNYIEDEAVIINLNTGNVEGEYDSTYFLDIFETKRNEDIEIASVLIFHELRKLVSMAFIITSFSLQEKDEGKFLLQEFTKNAPFPASFIKKALELSEKCNFIIRNLV